MNKVSFASLVLSIVALSACTYVGYSQAHHKRYAYIELKRVFDEFEMAKQDNKKLESIVSKRKLQLDSLGLDLKAEARMISTKNIKSGPEVEEFLSNKEAYMEKRKQVEEDNAALQREYNGEVTKQLNQYVKDYGEKHRYDLIFGADEVGGMMYADEKLNITNDVIKYINERYKGVSK